MSSPTINSINVDRDPSPFGKTPPTPPPPPAQDQDEKDIGKLDASQPMAPPPPSPPNGGLVAWTQVLGAFLIMFNNWGLANAFGTFQSYYESHRLSAYSPFSIAWIGSLQLFLLFTVGVVTGPLFDRGYYRALNGAGTFFMVFGMMITSVTHSYGQTVLAQGVCIGVGMGCLWTPAVAICAQYFTTRRAIAIGLAACGTAIGGLLYPVIFTQLVDKVGYGWSVRAMGFVSLATLIPVNIILVPLKTMTRRRSFFYFEMLREPYSLLVCVAVCVGFMGMFVPLFYIGTYAEAVGEMRHSLSSYLFSIINAALTLRVIPNYFADRVGVGNVIWPACSISAVLAFCWIAITSEGGIIAFCVLYGFASGTFISLVPSLVPAMTEDMSEIGSRLGVVFLFAGVGALVGNPIGGALLANENTRTHFLRLQVWSGATLAVAAVCLLLSNVLWKRHRVKRLRELDEKV